MIRPAAIDAATEDLARAGFLAPAAEAAELAAASDGDEVRLAERVERRVTGEPLAWITGRTTFCGETIAVHPGVYVPRLQTERMALEAAGLLAHDGIAVDLCTGSGAVAAVLKARHPNARVIGTDLDPTAATCARANGVETFEGDLAEALPPRLAGRVDVVTAVVPYVPTEAIHLLPRDVQAHEPRLALDGGEHGTALLIRAAEAAIGLLRPGGWLLFELGGNQDELVGPVLSGLGFADINAICDEENDLRFLRGRSPDET